jgi:hypothetical protein
VIITSKKIKLVELAKDVMFEHIQLASDINLIITSDVVTA